MKNTLLASMGFEDHDLKTPLHDEIVLWCMENTDFVMDKSGFPGRIGRKVIEQPVYRYGAAGYDGKRPALGILGYFDISVERFYTPEGSASEWIGIEVKTTIKSLGELIRQLRTTGTKIIVCPDDRLAEVLREQGFGFVKYPGPCRIAGDLFGA